MFGLLKKTITESQVPAEILGLPVRHNMRARRLSLRVDTKLGDVVLVWPKRASEKAAIRFVSENRVWIENQRSKIVKPNPIGEGTRISVHGRELTVVHETGRGLTRIDGDRLVVHGDPAHLQRRLRDFLKKEAEVVLKKRTDEMAAMIGLKPAPVRILDPKSRWGSCGPDGKIMYSWRIILAPPAVLDYLVAHETAHRIHMDHSRNFWKLCFSLCENGAISRRWLKTHGQDLMAI